MIKANKIIEAQLREDGYTKVKLKVKNGISSTRPHDFRYMHPHENQVNRCISILDKGSLLGVYVGSGWHDRYEVVDWDTPDCKCDMCSVLDSSEENLRIAEAFGYAVRNMENLDKSVTIDIYGLTLTQEDNDWKELSFRYKVQK